MNMAADEVVLTNVSECFGPVEYVEPGIQRMFLKTKQLYPEPEEHHQFEARLNEFLKIDNASRIMDYSNGLLAYLTESVIPPGRIQTHLCYSFSEILLLTRLGISAFLQVRKVKKNIDSGQPWKRAAFPFKKTTLDINSQRTKALFDLDYASDFRIGLAVFYSMPSPASDPKWNGVAGLRRLFHAKALSVIADSEKRRINHLIDRFAAVHLVGIY